MDPYSIGKVWGDDLKIAIVFAHPDDETMLIGGTLAMLADRGVELGFLLIDEVRRGFTQSAWRSELDAAGLGYTVVPTSRAFSPALATAMPLVSS